MQIYVNNVPVESIEISIDAMRELALKDKATGTRRNENTIGFGADGYVVTIHKLEPSPDAGLVIRRLFDGAAHLVSVHTAISPITSRF